MEVAKPIQTSFSTADADYPEIQQTDDCLTVSYTDWKEQEVTVIFTDVAAFKWQTIESLIENEQYDGCNEIQESSWLKAHIEQGAISSSEKATHWRFNFNACGQLEVIAGRFYEKT
jgi:hypothetical protein